MSKNKYNINYVMLKNNLKIFLLFFILILTFNCFAFFDNKKQSNRSLSENDLIVYKLVSSFNSVQYRNLQVLSGGFASHEVGGWFIVTYMDLNNNYKTTKFYLWIENDYVFYEQCYDDYYKFFSTDEFNINKVNEYLRYKQQNPH